MKDNDELINEMVDIQKQINQLQNRKSNILREKLNDTKFRKDLKNAMADAKDVVVLGKENVVSKMTYQLRQLPDGINFIWKERLYRTITYPRYNTGAMNGGIQTRPCLNLRSLKDEDIRFGEVVIIV